MGKFLQQKSQERVRYFFSPQRIKYFKYLKPIRYCCWHNFKNILSVVCMSDHFLTLLVAGKQPLKGSTPTWEITSSCCRNLELLSLVVQC